MKLPRFILIWPLLAHGAAWAAFLWLLLWPFSYRGVSVTSTQQGVGKVPVAPVATHFSESIIEVNGPVVLIPLFVPVALTGLALLAVWVWNASPIVKRLSLWALAAVCLVFCVLGALSIGVFYLPAALALLITAIVGTFQPPTRRRPGPATL
jgi:hypothetical protein